MGQLDESDLERVADAVREVTGEYPIQRTGLDFKSIVSVAGLLLGLGAAVAAIGVSRARADEAWTEAKAHEQRITKLEVLQAEDKRLLERVEAALEANVKALHDVQIELAKARRP